MNELVRVENQQVVTDSRSVAEHFEKQHKHVLEAIDNLVAENSATKNMFCETSREYRGQSFRYFLMNRDGFSLLVMGFTGAKALEWKLKYIKAFNAMEKELEQKPLSQLEILQGSINQLIEQNKRLSRVEMKQEEQDKQMGYINTSIEVLNGVCTEGTKRERLNQMVRAYANKAGLTYAKAWHKFREAFNVAFHTSIGLLIAHYTQKNSLKKKISVPEYLEATERIDDALRVIEKMLNELPRQAAS